MNTMQLDQHIAAARGIVKIDPRTQQKTIANERIKKARNIGYLAKRQSAYDSTGVFVVQLILTVGIVIAVAAFSS